ncbi:MAG: hypothetical protein ABI183_13640 [Polyangiaceae bacterium]
MRSPSIVVSSFFTLGLGVVLSASACSSSSSGTTTPTTLTCANPGAATPGNADTHCKGATPQSVDPASCGVNDAGLSGGGTEPDDAGDDDAGAEEDCEYGTTMFGNAGDDDDCKYHVVWSATPICEGVPGVTFTATITNLTDNSPVTGVPDGLIMEVFQPTDSNASCDDMSTHPSPEADNLIESPAGSGTYKGRVVFDASGQWTVRFHIHEECADVLDDSPHGHAAFRVTVP